MSSCKLKRAKGDGNVTTVTTLMVILGVSYASWIITKFIVWLDAADEPDVPVAKAEVSFEREVNQDVKKIA